MPLRTEKETPEMMANLFLQLFIALDVKDVSLQDIDIAHRVPARQVSSRPNAIIFKLVRRLAKNKVMGSEKKYLNCKLYSLDSRRVLLFNMSIFMTI